MVLLSQHIVDGSILFTALKNYFKYLQIFDKRVFVGSYPDNILWTGFFVKHWQVKEGFAMLFANPLLNLDAIRFNM